MAKYTYLPTYLPTTSFSKSEKLSNELVASLADYVNFQFAFYFLEFTKKICVCTSKDAFTKVSNQESNMVSVMLAFAVKVYHSTYFR